LRTLTLGAGDSALISHSERLISKARRSAAFRAQIFAVTVSDAAPLRPAVQDHLRALVHAISREIAAIRKKRGFVRRLRRCMTAFQQRS
jgi:alanyl-tRNA synthetase